MFIMPKLKLNTSYEREFRLILFISLNKLSTPISSGSNASTVDSTCLKTFFKFPSWVTVYISTNASVGSARGSLC